MLTRLICRLALALIALLTISGVLGVRLAADWPGIPPLAYTRERVQSGQLTQRADVYLFAPMQRLTYNLTRTPDWQEYAPVWSPDGARLAVIAYTTQAPDNRLCVIGVTVLPALTCWRQGGWYEHVIWLSATRLAFGFDDETTGMPGVYRLDLTVGGLSPLLAADADWGRYVDGLAARDRESVSADGRWRVWAQHTDQRARLLVAPTDGSTPPHVLSPDDGADYFYPVWWVGR